jgi:GT2 family glycosyltransferase
MPRDIDVLIPTYDRPAPLAVTLATLVGQTFRNFLVVISDQTGEDGAGTDARVVRAVAQVRLVEVHGGCGFLPTRAYHQVVGTTMANREVDAPEELL